MKKNTKKRTKQVPELTIEQMKELAELTGLENDSYQTVDARLFSENGAQTADTLSMSKKEYEAMEKDLSKFTISGPGFEVYAWNDISGYNYWTVRQEENNYIMITVLITDYKKARAKIKEIKAAVDEADAHFSKYYLD